MFSLYLGGEAAAVELNGYRVAEGDLGGVAEDNPIRVRGNGVAAFEDLQRAALVELQQKFFKAVAFAEKQALGADAEFGAAFFEAQTERGDFHAKIKRDDAEMRGGEAFARLFEARAKAEGEARGHLIGALALLAQKIERAAETAPGGKLVDAAGKFQQAIAD